MSASSRQHGAFTAYVDLGPTRSLAKLQALLRSSPESYGFTKAPSLRTLESWSTAYSWAAELQSLERKAHQEEASEHIERVKAYRERLRQEGLLLQQKGISWLATKEPDDVRTQEAIRAIGEGFRLEALGLGEVTDRIAVEEDYSHVVSRLSDDELDRLVAVLRAAAPAPVEGTGSQTT